MADAMNPLPFDAAEPFARAAGLLRVGAELLALLDTVAAGAELADLDFADKDLLLAADLDFGPEAVAPAFAVLDDVLLPALFFFAADAPRDNAEPDAAFADDLDFDPDIFDAPDLDADDFDEADFAPDDFAAPDFEPDDFFFVAIPISSGVSVYF